MSLFHMLPFCGESSTVTVTAGTAAADDLTAGADECYSEWIFNADGTVDKDEDGTVAQQNSTTDWIVPNGYSKRPWYIRFTEVSYTENQTNPALIGVKSGDTVDGSTWHTLGGTQARSIRLTTSSNTAGAGDITWVVKCEIASDAAGTDIRSFANKTMTGQVGG